jgi:hypothetical protein
LGPIGSSFEFALQFVDELLAEPFVLEIAFVCIIEGFPAHPINSGCLRTVIGENMLKCLLNPLAFTDEVIQVFELMIAMRLCLAG